MSGQYFMSSETTMILNRQQPASTRSKSPIFVLGCGRSGTTLLYHMVLSSGNFAIYRAESNVFSVLVPKFGNLASTRNREHLMDYWLRSKLFSVTDLDADEIRAKIMTECRSGGDFLRIVMEAVAAKQGVSRWADCTPDHLLYLDEIREQIPDAKIIHIIRDGRDVALSYVKQGWAYPLPWDRRQHLAVAGLYWEWIVRKGRQLGAAFGDAYQEVHFEDLVEHPHEVLGKLGDFIGQELNYEQIVQVGLGSVSEPNSSFVGGPGDAFNPVGRWKENLTGPELAGFENLVGGFLKQLGYPLVHEERNNLQTVRLRNTYMPMFTAKQWLKDYTPLGRLTSISRMEMEDPHTLSYASAKRASR